MNFARSRRSLVAVSLALFIGIFVLAIGPSLKAQDAETAKKLQGFDAYMENSQRLECAGRRSGDRGRRQTRLREGLWVSGLREKAALHATTLCQIASNTKLFTAMAAGLLVDEGKLTWDKPVRDSVSAIQFYNDSSTTPSPSGTCWPTARGSPDTT